MEKRELKLYGTKAVILMLRHQLPPMSALENWKTHGIKTILISPEKPLIRKLKKKPEMLELLDASHRIHLKEFRKRGALSSYYELAMLLMNSLSKQTVFIVDDPLLLRTAEKKLFDLKLGVNGDSGRKSFYDNGAVHVLDSFDELNFAEGLIPNVAFEQSIPHLFRFGIADTGAEMVKEPVFFFDYDGTIAPIVKNPAKAYLPEEIRVLLDKLGREFRVALISGRDMDDLKSFVKLDHLIYAGSHGYRISGPKGLYHEHNEAVSMLNNLDRIESDLRSTLEQNISGVTIERKYFAIAVHYRNAHRELIGKIKKKIDQVIAENPEFIIGKGKKLLEVKPGLNWHKGKAVEWILRELGMEDTNKYTPIFLGDDITDEDAFKTLSDIGYGILVGDHGSPSAARYRLKDIDQVKSFMHHILQTVYVST